MTKRNLILIHRGPEYEKDFDEIAAKVNRLDESITIYHLPAQLDVQLPLTAWQHPTLTIALTPSFRISIKRGPVLKNSAISKLEQLNVLRRNGIPIPPAMEFEFGKKLDPILFGEFVLIKPLNLQLTSTGHGVHVLRRVRAEQIKPLRFSSDHPIRNGEKFIVQRFVYTGQKAASYRVTTLLGRILFAAKFRSNSISPDLSSPDDQIETASYTAKGDRTITFEFQDQMLELARRVAIIFKDIPLLGIDLIQDVVTSKWYVLEINGGGNTWHFSSKLWADYHLKNPEALHKMKSQFSAFDAAAEALAETVQELAG